MQSASDGAKTQRAQPFDAGILASVKVKSFCVGRWTRRVTSHDDWHDDEYPIGREFSASGRGRRAQRRSLSDALAHVEPGRESPARVSVAVSARGFGKL